MVTNQQAKQQRKDVEDAATAILALLDMGNEEAAAEALAIIDRHYLGLVITTWYQMCVAYRKADIVGNAARRTAEHLRANAMKEGAEPAEAAADDAAGSLLACLADNRTERYAKMWQSVITSSPDVSTAAAARALGFTRGVLSPPEGE